MRTFENHLNAKHMKTRMTIRVTELQIGDELSTGTVTHRPYDSVRCPKGKIHLGVNGFLKTWNKSTTITIQRANA